MKTYSRKTKRSGATVCSACPSKDLTSSLPDLSANQRNRSSGATSDRHLLGSQPSLTSPEPRPSSDPFAFLSSDEEGGNPIVRAPARGDGKTAAPRKIATQARAGSAIASQPKGSKPSVDPWALDFTDDVASKNGSQSQHDPEFLRSLMASAESGDTSGDDEPIPQPAVKRRSHSQSQSLSKRQSGIQLPRLMLPPPSLPRGWSADDPQIVRRVADRSEYEGPSLFPTTGLAAHRPLPVERPASQEIPGRGSFPDGTNLGGSLPKDGPQAGGGYLTMIESQESVSGGIAKPHTNLRISRETPPLYRSGSAPSSQPSQYQPPFKRQHLAALAAHRSAIEGRKPSLQRDSVQGGLPEKDTANGNASGNTFEKSKVEVAGRASLQRRGEVGSQGKNHSGTSSQGSGPKQASKRSAGGSGRVSGSSQRPTGVAAASAMLQRQKSGGPSTVAARTVVEAEESGEDTQLLDDALYALQGLSVSASPATRLDSALAMADIGATQRGRRTLRTAGVLQEVLAAASQLPLETEPLLCLALAALLAFFSQQAADQVVLSTPESLRVLAKLFLVNSDSDTGSECEVRVLKLVQSACGASEGSPAWVALSILAAATDPHRSPTTSDALKPLLRTSGLLDTLTDATVEGITQCCAPGGGGMGATGSNFRLQRRLQLLLVILENTTFACPENEEHLVSRPQTITSSPPSGSPFSQTTSFCGWLTAQLPEVGRAARDGRLPNGCMHSAVAVLMNVTHNSSVGREAVAAANGVEIVGHMMLSAACAQIAGRQEVGGKLAGEGVETLSELLGLLINLVEVSSANREQLLSLELAESPSEVDGVTVTEPEPQRMVPLLCQLMLGSSRHESEGAKSGVQRLASDEITEEQLDGREGAGDESILEVYVSMMLGFLVVDDPIRRREAEALLPGHSLRSVASAVERALHFYVNTGAITVQAEASLRQLVASLRA